MIIRKFLININKDLIDISLMNLLTGLSFIPQTQGVMSMPIVISHPKVSRATREWLWFIISKNYTYFSSKSGHWKVQQPSLLKIQNRLRSSDTYDISVYKYHTTVRELMWVALTSLRSELLSMKCQQLYPQRLNSFRQHHRKEMPGFVEHVCPLICG